MIKLSPVALVAAAFVFAGCGPTLGLSAMKATPSWSNIEIFSVSFAPEEGSECAGLAGPSSAKLGDLDGTFDAGGSLGAGCARPRFLFTDPDDANQDGAVTAIVDDGDADLAVDVEAGDESGSVVVKDGLSHMTLDGAPASVVAGDGIAFAVSHATWLPIGTQVRSASDDFIELDVAFDGVNVSGLARAKGGAALAAGEYTLQVDLLADPDAFECDGVAGCETGFLTRRLEAALTIAP